MGSGDVGFIGSGTKRVLELPDGNEAPPVIPQADTTRDPRRAALRYDGASGQLQISYGGGPWGSVSGSGPVSRVESAGTSLARDTDIILVNEGDGAVTISLPALVLTAPGQRIRVVDATSGGSAGITVAVGLPGDTINGAALNTTVVVGENNFVELVAEPATTNWQIIARVPNT